MTPPGETSFLDASPEVLVMVGSNEHRTVPADSPPHIPTAVLAGWLRSRPGWLAPDRRPGWLAPDRRPGWLALVTLWLAGSGCRSLLVRFLLPLSLIPSNVQVGQGRAVGENRYTQGRRVSQPGPGRGSDRSASQGLVRPKTGVGVRLAPVLTGFARLRAARVIRLGCVCSFSGHRAAGH